MWAYGLLDHLFIHPQLVYPSAMPKPTTITAYYKSLPSERAKRLRDIHQLIKKEFPKAKASLKYKMPTFETGEKTWIAIGNQKNYVSVYTCSKDKIAPFVKKHPEIKCGTGCLNFRDSQDLHLADLKQVVVNALRGD